MIKKGISLLPKSDWGFGLMIEREDSWDNYFSIELSLFKVRFWLFKSFRSDDDVLEKDLLGV